MTGEGAVRRRADDWPVGGEALGPEAAPADGDPCRSRRPGGFARLSPSSPPRWTLSLTLGYFIRPTPYSVIVCRLVIPLVVLRTSLLTLMLAFATVLMRVLWPLTVHALAAAIRRTCMGLTRAADMAYLARYCTLACTCARTGYPGPVAVDARWHCRGR